MRGLREQLEETLQGRVCLMGLGNASYGDDGFGILLAEELRSAGLPDVVVAGVSPERFIGAIESAGFDHLVFLDAVEFGGAPGSVIFLNSAEMFARFPQVSTHKISLGFLAQCAEASGRARAWLLGVQPESLKAGEPLTATLKQTLNVLREYLIAARPSLLEQGAATMGLAKDGWVW